MRYNAAINIFNSLIQTHTDRMMTYDESSKNVLKPELKIFFNELALTSEECNEDLMDEVIRLGGNPVLGPSSQGEMFTIWNDINSAVIANSLSEIIRTCEIAQEKIVKQHENTLRNLTGELSVNQKSLIHIHLYKMRLDHNKVKTMADRVITIDQS